MNENIMTRGTKSENAVEPERRKFIKSAIIGSALSAATLGAGNGAAQGQNSMAEFWKWLMAQRLAR